MKKVLSIVFAGLVTVGLANAAITTALVDVTGSGPYTWNYEISVDSLEELVAGTSYFTIYDFTDYVPGTITAPTGWTDSVQLLGITPATQNPTDSATLENLTFTYEGTGNPTNISDLTGFSAESSLGSVASTGGQFTYQATKISTGGLDQGIGSVEVPTATPEPVTTGLIGLALVGMAVARRKFAR
jgi:hypothetical protein